MPVPWRIHYDRRLDQAFLQHFLPHGFAASLRRYATEARYPLDLQTRKDPKTDAQHVTLYAGLTAVVNVVRRPDGKMRLTTDAHWRELSGVGWQPHWGKDHSPDEWERKWSSVEDYLEAVIPVATQQKGTTEGAVQAAVSGFSSAKRVMLDREMVFAFRDAVLKKEMMTELSRDLVSAAAAMRGIPGAPKTSFGGRCDVLALDDRGRLLAVEVKPKNTGTIVWAGLQATMYARLLRRWLEEPVHANWPSPQEVLTGLLEQRRALNPRLRGPDRVSETPEVVPVVALQRGANQTYLDRLLSVQEQAHARGVVEPSLEIHLVSITGALIPPK